MMMIGSRTLVAALARDELIDEYRPEPISSMSA